jgi:hypothetical protein
MVHIRHVCVPKDYMLMLINHELLSCEPIHSSLLDLFCDCKHKLTWQVPVLECYSAKSIFWVLRDVLLSSELMHTKTLLLISNVNKYSLHVFIYRPVNWDTFLKYTGYMKF